MRVRARVSGCEGEGEDRPGDELGLTVRPLAPASPPYCSCRWASSAVQLSRSVAQALGYEFINTDDCWSQKNFDPQTKLSGRGPAGRILPAEAEPRPRSERPGP